MEIAPHRALPGGRAVLGGVLMALAVIGVYVAWAEATDRPSDPLVVAARAIRPGEVIEASDLTTAEGDLPDGAEAYGSVDDVIGHVALGPVGEGEIVQRSSVTEDRSPTGQHEIAVSLPRRQIAVGRLRVGERVDVFVTYDERTSSVVRGAEVVQIGAEEDVTLTSDREIALVVAVPSGEAVAALVHALRTGDVTVVRSTFAEPSDEDPIEFEGAGATVPEEER